MKYNTTEEVDSAYTRISAALDWRPDETILRDGGSFAEFQAAAIAAWDDAPVGEAAAPESCGTIAVTIRRAA